VHCSSLVLLLCFAAVPDAARAEPTPAPLVAVPFGCGLAFPVTQVHAVGTHVDNDLWAWDFRMPEGTPVVAALDGVVRLARGDSTEGGCDPALAAAANYVVLEHSGGLESQYLHFSRVTVEVGQHVKQGQLLGYSGKTGHIPPPPSLQDGLFRRARDGTTLHCSAHRGYGDPALGTRCRAPPSAPAVARSPARSPAPGARRWVAACGALSEKAPVCAIPSWPGGARLALHWRVRRRVRLTVVPPPR
jgi:hypothetical protein